MYYANTNTKVFFTCNILMDFNFLIADEKLNVMGPKDGKRIKSRTVTRELLRLRVWIKIRKRRLHVEI